MLGIAIPVGVRMMKHVVHCAAHQFAFGVPGHCHHRGSHEGGAARAIDPIHAFVRNPQTRLELLANGGQIMGAKLPSRVTSHLRAQADGVVPSRRGSGRVHHGDTPTLPHGRVFLISARYLCKGDVTGRESLGHPPALEEADIPGDF